MRETRLKTDVLAYNDTIGKGLDLFFSSYDIDYAAHETAGSIDYPLSNDNMQLTGIEYIQQYIQKLQLENEFCGHFPLDEIECLMSGYSRGYKELLFNIYDLVFVNAIGGILLGRDDFNLNITEYDRQYLQKQFSALSKEKIRILIDRSLIRLCERFSISDQKLMTYMKASSENLKSRLDHALEINDLQHLFLSSEYEDTANTVLFQDSAMLDNDEFRTLADEIRECLLISDKIVLLKRAPLSMTDFVDLLEGDCFYGDEYFDVFRTLEDVQLALLLKRLPSDPTDSYFLEEESEKEWHSSFDAFLNQIAPERKEMLHALAQRIELA